MWKTKKLGEICDFKQGIQVDKNLQKEIPLKKTDVRFLRIIDFTQSDKVPRYINFPGESYLVKKKDVSLVRYGNPGFVCRGLEGAIANNLFRVIPKTSNLSCDFIFWFLSSPNFQTQILKSQSGVAMQAINFGMIKDIPILFPSLSEQKRITTKLDAAFTEIDNSVLINKSKLSSLRTIGKKIINKLILKNGSDFIKRPIHSLFNLSSGKFLPRKKMNLKGKIKVYGGNGITGYHDTFNLENENILIGRVGAYCGNVYYTNEKIWLTDNCLHINSYKYDFNKQFLSMLLSNLNIRAYAHQAAQPAISYTSLKDIELIFPKSIHEQTIIFKKYIDLKSNFKNLNNNYESQMISLKKLKLSILNKEIFNEAV